MILAVAGVFWFNVAAWGADCVRAGISLASGEQVPLHYLQWEMPVALACALVIAFFAFRMGRRVKGVSLREFREADPKHRAATRRMIRLFRLATVGEGVLCGTAVWLCVHFHRTDLIFPGIGLGASLHFIPLASIFGVPPYRYLGFAGAIVSALDLLIPATPEVRLVFLGIAMGADMWLGAIYMLLRFDRLSADSPG
jgi:hypothetical protein